MRVVPSVLVGIAGLAGSVVGRWSFAGPVEFVEDTLRIVHNELGLEKWLGLGFHARWLDYLDGFAR